MPTTWLDNMLKQTRRVGTFPYPHQAAFALNNPLRRLGGSHEKTAEKLGLQGSERVLEVGPGPGYFRAAADQRPPRAV